MCKVVLCERESAYVDQDVCQMHYFRYMRNKSYDTLPKRRKFRVENQAGYQQIYKPNCPLSDHNGYVYEHRYKVYRYLKNTLSSCELCGDDVSWSNCHIDHIDENVRNNTLVNLRPLCRPCNVFRGHTATTMGKMFLTIQGKTLNPSAWSRQAGVKVAGQTIRRRKLLGWSDYDSVFKGRLTHKATATAKTKAKYDVVRGI